jgi:hypothetical protein
MAADFFSVFVTGAWVLDVGVWFKRVGMVAATLDDVLLLEEVGMVYEAPKRPLPLNRLLLARYAAVD